MIWTRKSKSRRRRRKRDDSWSLIAGVPTRSIIGYSLVTGCVVCLFYLAAVGVNRLDAHVQQDLLSDYPEAAVVFTDLPPSLELLALADLYVQIADLLHQPWTQDSLCKEMGERLSRVSWVDKLRYVRRSGSGQSHVGAQYRIPVAMVQQNNAFLLVDANGIRLPGQYRFDPSWRLIQGVSEPAPAPGLLWEGDDLRAGLAIWALIDQEPFRNHITSVLVGNFGGRINLRATHIELATDRKGGRIRWGSAPGLELEESTISQKLAILRANLRATGRADARHKVIDITTYADRYTIPG